jgi:4-hydroxythreonine-4-phosphate dehydrogenase
VRTSPDHGTGYDIAGKNEADPASFRHALYAAVDIFKQRSEQTALEAGANKGGQVKLERERN